MKCCITLLSSRGRRPYIFCDGNAWKYPFILSLGLKFLQWQTTDTYWMRGFASQGEIVEWTRRISDQTLWEQHNFILHLRLVTIYTKIRPFQTKFPYKFSLYSNAQIEGKEREVWCITQLYLIASSGKYIAHNKYIQVQWMFKNPEGYVSYPTPVLYVELLFLLMIIRLAVTCRPYQQIAGIYVVLL
jgi:hypothetical protein